MYTHPEISVWLEIWVKDTDDNGGNDKQHQHHITVQTGQLETRISVKPISASEITFVKIVSKSVG